MTQPFPFPTSFQAPSAPQTGNDLALTLLGPSAAMSQLWSQIRRLAPHLRVALLSGEPDCGQEAVARLLLDLSPAPKRTFVKITAADAENRLLRPTGLTSLPADVFLFLPDIDRLSLGAAEGILRLMRMRRSRPFTIVASATEDLRSLAAAGRFPAELAAALTSIRLQVPSVKQRYEDLPMLLGHLLSTRAREAGRAVPQTSESFLRAAMEYAWPGNLQELSRLAVSLVQSTTETRELTATDFHRALATQQTHRGADLGAVRLVSLDTVMQEHINAVLRACRGNKLRAAEVLGISRSTLYRMLDAAAVQNTSFPIAS